MKGFVFVLAVLLSCSDALWAQYEFTTEREIACTSVKNQARTATCWSYSTLSFLESELLRLGHPSHDLSEMFIVRNIYRDKALNYVLRQGKANFSQGSLSHDVLRAYTRGGIVPESVFSGLPDGQETHNHKELEAALRGLLEGVVESKRPSAQWLDAFDCILDTYLGTAPETFVVGEQQYTPEQFANSLPLVPDDYVTLTSFTHHPFYRSFILEIPDNYSNGSYYNVPLDDLQAVVDQALAAGYTVAWDGDVSEKGFNAKKGVAVLPVTPDREDLFEQPGAEVTVDQQNRQDNFMNYNTTDDHLMHLTGTATDQNGKRYYQVKNSWGELSTHGGFLYMSQPYFRMKTVGVMVHKDAIPASVRRRLQI